MNICVTQEFVLNWSGVLWKTQSRVSVRQLHEYDQH